MAAPTLCLDAMGGDSPATPASPASGLPAAVEGAARFSLESDARVLLVGDGPAIRRELDRHPHDPRHIELVAAQSVVPMGGDAAVALDTLPSPSILVAARLVAEGAADALISAGHTGATILAAGRLIPRLDGVRRAPLAAVYPTEQRRGPRNDPFALLLDVGATVGATEEDLVSFAIMGSAYAALFTEVERPRVALLSNGSEPNRGTPAIVAAHARLLGHPAVNFLGNVEGLDIPRGTADVIVCDGFLGNVVLKMFEGMAETLVGLVREARDQSLLWRMGLSLVGQDLRELRRVTDWKQYGGAPLLGLRSVVIKAHGRSNGRAFRNALKVAAKAVCGDLPGAIARGMSGG